MEDVRKELKVWLDRKFNEWQIEVGRATITEFADYLDIPRPQLSHYMNARNKPEGENIEKIASKLGNTIYDILGLQRPEPELRYIHQLFDEIEPHEQKDMMKHIKEFADERKYQVEEQLLESDPENES